jgi:phospholipid/cholesterol/gamma-HCH transport system substrate-binding protein
MAKRTIQEIRVGLFIFVGLALAFIFVFSIGSEKHLFEKQYTLYVHFKDVGGLRAGAPVRLAGVDVGTVSMVSFPTDLKKKLIDVELKINTNVKKRIREDSVASINTKGVLGDKYISITMGSPDKKIMADGQRLTSVESVELFGYLERADKIVDNTLSITESLDTFLKPIKDKKSGENVASIIESADEIVTEIKDGEGSLHTIIYGGQEETADTISNLDASLVSLRSILEKVDKGEGTLGALVNDPTAYEDLKILLGGAKRSKVIKAVVNYSIQKKKKEIEKEEKQDK